ncbi:MAG TPA: shikimate kinase [Acidimicrobiales bacterium]
MHVVLVGPMAVGKSTVGHLLAERLGRPLRDSDEDLLAERGVTGAEVAVREGVDALHRWEASHLLRALAGDRPAVIAAAASVVDDPACRAALRAAFVVWLRAPVELLVDRLGDDDHRRRLGATDVGDLIRTRAPRYAAVADAAVDASAPVGDVAGRVLAALPRAFTT